MILTGHGLVVYTSTDDIFPLKKAKTTNSKNQLWNSLDAIYKVRVNKIVDLFL